MTADARAASASNHAGAADSAKAMVTGARKIADAQRIAGARKTGAARRTGAARAGERSQGIRKGATPRAETNRGTVEAISKGGAGAPVPHRSAHRNGTISKAREDHVASDLTQPDLAA